MEGSTAIRYKVPGRSKTKAWVNDILIFAGQNLSLYSSNSVRENIREGIINLDLYNGKLHPSDVVGYLNPLGLQTIDTSRIIPHYPIATPIIDLLVGEEISALFEPLVEIVNNVGIEEKQQRMRAYVQQKVDAIVEQAGDDQEAIKVEVKKLQRHLKYTYKDIVEKKASALLADYSKKDNFKEVFVEGYRRVFNLGEECYEIDIVHGEPKLRVINTLNLRLYGGGSSPRMEARDLIVVEDHYSPGYLIDRYGAKLTTVEVERILNYSVGGLGSESTTGRDQGHTRFDKPYGDVGYEFKDNTQTVGNILGSEFNTSLVDSNGGIRHQRTRWKAYKQIKRIKFQDPDTGEEILKTRSETYKLQPGEVLDKKIWIEEWWIGTLIGYDITVDAHPIPIRFNGLSRFSEGHPGIVGEVYNINERKVVPVMSRMKPFQYWYDIIVDNMIVAMSKNIGPILEMDLAKRPVKWDTKKWLHYITKYNVKFVDSFKELNKGPGKGQLAGNLASGRDQVTQLDFGNYIQQLVSMAQYLERAMADIIGITPQRLGSVSNRETVGGVERATSQSSHITEWYSFKHEQVKLRVLNVYVEAAKTALRDNPKKLQTIIDSTTREILSITGDDVVNSDLGVYVTNSKKVKENKMFLEQAAQAHMQNGGDFGFVFNVMFSDSMSEKRRLIEANQEEQMAAAQEQRQQEMQIMQEQTKQAQAQEDKKLELDKYKADLDAMVKIKLKEYDVAIAEGRIQADKEKSLDDLKSDIMQMQTTMSVEDKKAKVAQEKVDNEKTKLQQAPANSN